MLQCQIQQLVTILLLIFMDPQPINQPQPLTNALLALQDKLGANVSTQQSRLQLIKQTFPVLYILLAKLSAGTPPAQNENLITNFFLPGKPELNTCRSKITYSYICRTCHQDKQQKICFMCFNTSKHENHNYYIKQTNGQCECGIPGFGNFCYSHTNSHNYLYSQTVRIQESQQSYAAFFVELFIVYANMKSETRKLLEKPLKQVFDRIYALNQKSLTHVKASHLCLSLHFPQINAVLIDKLLSINEVSTLPEYIIKLIKLLANNYAPFQLLLLDSVSRVKQGAVYSLSYLRGLEACVKKLTKSVTVLGNMAKQGNIIYHKNMTWAIKIEYRLIFMDMIAKPNRYKQQQKYLIPIFKVLMQKDCLPTNYSPQLVQFMLTKASLDLPLMQKMLEKQIDQKSLSIYEKSINQWYNVIVRSVLHAVKGQVQQFGAFFKNIKMETVIKLVSFYFCQIFRTHKKCKFNGLTSKCLFKVAKQFDLIKYIKNFSTVNSEQKQINCKKFSENCFIFLRNLIASDHMTAFWLLKIAQQEKNRQKIKQYKQIIVQWFKDFLYIRQQIPKSLIRSLKQFGIINFKQALAVLENQVEFSEDRRIFIYKGQQRNINKDSLFSQSAFPTLLNDTKYQDYSRSLFCTTQRKQILMALLDENIAKVSIDKYSSYSNQEKRKICLTAIIVDNILQGQSSNVNKYLEALKQANQKFKKKDKVLLKLFNLQASEVQPKTTTTNLPLEMVEMVEMDQIKTEPPQIQQTKLVQLTQPLILPNQQIIAKKQTEASLAAKQKRQQKMNRLKQKFANKSQKYSQHQILSKPIVQQQVCLICRQEISRQKQKSFLFYLANLKCDQLTQMLFGLDNELMVTSCFHPFHQKCISNNSNNNTCTLCKTQGNFILPVLNSSMESQVFVKAWWDDFLALKSFTPKPATSSYGYYSYYSQPVASTKKPEQKLQQISLNQKPQKYKNFLIIFKCLIFRISSIITKAKWEDSLQKHTYFINLIKFFVDQLDSKEKFTLTQELKEYDQKFEEKKVNEYVKDLARIASKALQLKFELFENEKQRRKIIQKVLESCEQIRKKYAQNLIQNFLKNIEWLLLIKVSPEQSMMQSKPISSAQVLKYLYKFQLPPTMQQTYKLREKCTKCNQMNGWHCLFCKANGCKNCEQMHNHVKTNHGNNNILFVMTSTGKLANVAATGLIKQNQLYFDIFGDAFNQETSLSLADYKFNSRKINAELDTLFKKF